VIVGVPDWLADSGEVAHVHHRPARPGRPVDWPAWVSPEVRAALAARGIERPWSHQAEAADAAWSGRHVAVATGTASGKSLAYLLPILEAGLHGRPGRDPAGSRPRLALAEDATALYLAPTKALAHDQLGFAAGLDLPGWRVGALDGDSSTQERRFARDFAHYVFSNPDMLHRSLLPQHARWTRLLRTLSFVVVDEAHRYKGVFGAHVAAVLRRLRRLCRRYGSDPTFVFASATIRGADAVGCALAGLDSVHLVDEDGSPAPALDLVLTTPTPRLTETTATLLARLCGTGQTLAFTTSRVQAELVAIRAREIAGGGGGGGGGGSIAAYRGGYLADDRRALEHQLRSGALRGVACTNALELGVDIAGVDAVVTAGFPGTLAALWQQVGRAGRTGRDALAVLVAREDPLDAYLSAHPELVWDRPIEQTVVYADNPYVLGPHLAAAAQEAPLTEADETFFGPTTVPLAEQLAAQGVLRRRPGGWYWTRPQRAVDSIDLRSMRGKACEVVDEATGRVIGQVDPSAADRTLHPDAVYVHQGESWIIASFDERDRVALARRATPTWFTQPQSVTGIRVLTTRRSRPFGLGTVHLGTIELESQVTGYLRRDGVTGQVWDSTPLDLPARHFTTVATWWTLPDAVLADLDLADADLGGAAHAAEHTAIGLLPVFVPCDRWDVGGLSTVLHPDTGALTVFVHDGTPGGAGFSELGFEQADAWWAATLERLTDCPCDGGCPACVVSPKCGSGNQPLDKAGAAVLVASLTRGHR